MELNFIKEHTIQNRYSIANREKTLYYALYDPVTKYKEIFDNTSAILLRGYQDPSKTHKFFNSSIPYIVENFSMQDKAPAAEPIIFHSKLFPYSTYYFHHCSSQYEAIEHFGTKISIFQNGNQIAYFEKGINSFRRDLGLKLVCNSGVDIPLLCLFCIYIYSDFTDEHAGEAPAFNISFQKKKFDKNWKPE